MILSEYVKRNAGRWLDRKLPPVAPVSSPLVQVFELDGAEPDHATPRAARTLMVGDEVWTDGEWIAVAEGDPLPGRWVVIVKAQPGLTVDVDRCGPVRCMVLGLADGTEYRPPYEELLVSRDAEEQALAAKESAL